MQALNDIFATIDGYVGGSTWFVWLLVGTGLWVLYRIIRGWIALTEAKSMPVPGRAG